MNSNTIIGISIGIVVVVWLIWRMLTKRKRRLNTDPNQINWEKVRNGAIQLSEETKQTTPLGATVYSLKGVSAEQLALVDSGLSMAFRGAKGSNYSEALDHAFYSIFIPKANCVPAPESKVPAFLVRADAYDGTNFDFLNPKGVGVKDGIGVIYAAEMVLNFGPLRGEMVACSDLSVIENAVRFGAEHIIIARNSDIDYFFETQFHDKKSHPLLPKA